MAIGHAQTVKVVGINVTSVTSSGITTTGGNLLVAGCGSWLNAGSQNLVVTDSKTNTWTENPAGPKAPDSKTRIHQFYVPNAIGGATHTFTATGSAGSYMALFVSEFSGIALTSPLDKSAGATGNSGAPSSGVTATRTQSDEVLVGMSGTDDGGGRVWNAGTGFTIPANGNQDVGDSYVAAVEYQIVSATGTEAATYTFSSLTSPWAAIIGTYKAAGADPIGKQYFKGTAAQRASSY